ncbi:hypothetical protein [Ligilactobacillus salivarius]|uniref:hypothetical protein n=1 Tax=Ligilactobacillus salivarius TaxID=1624 RepID=UPI0024BBB402|nr:hypothetical protein [Ligilactobacillus salivarius]
MSHTKHFLEELRVLQESFDQVTAAMSELNTTLNRMLDKEDQDDEVEVAPKRDIQADKEAVRGMLAKQASKGLTKEVKELLKKFGAEKLSDVDPKDYEDLYYSAESLDK